MDLAQNTKTSHPSRPRSACRKSRGNVPAWIPSADQGLTAVRKHHLGSVSLLNEIEPAWSGTPVVRSLLIKCSIKVRPFSLPNTCAATIGSRHACLDQTIGKAGRVNSYTNLYGIKPSRLSVLALLFSRSLLQKISCVAMAFYREHDSTRPS